MTDDVTRDKLVEMVRISYIFHTKLEIHKFDFLERILIILYENMRLYVKNTKKSENRIKYLKKIVEILVLDPFVTSLSPGLGKIDSFTFLLNE